ncbi:hypothetical protein ACSHXN_45645 (plasmid) [Streptomyces sp. HUAS TT11]|uniref:hypothetical protein n=1 Tax=Streptomyces sp. HUAS TT11 TaxID=3447508 RepID=UPI003F658FBE
MGNLSDPEPVLTRFAQTREAVTAKYGSDSQAVTFLYYEELISLRTLLTRDRASTVLRGRVGELVDIIQTRFHAGGAREPARTFHRTVATDPVVIEYDRAHFERQYRRALELRARTAVRIRHRAQAMSVIEPGASYLYAVDDDGSLLLWPEACRLADLMFGWAPGRPVDPDRVVHPMLVPDRLRVRAAGEMILVGTEASLAVVANLRSGHFRPPAPCAVELRRAAGSAFELDDPADVDVFVMPESGRPPSPKGNDDESAHREPAGSSVH